MELLLLLKSGIETLTNDECITFMQSINKKYFATILFNNFFHDFNNFQTQSEFNTTISKLKTFNEEISKIVSLRESKPPDNKSKPKSKSKSIQFDDLPSIMISEIASFLPFDDLKSIELSNRSIFIGTRSPISLNQLSPQYSSKLISYLTENQSENDYFFFHRFQSIKTLTLNISNFYDDDDYDWSEYNYKLNRLPLFPQLNHLNIAMDKDCHEEKYIDEPFMQHLKLFLANHNIEIACFDFIDYDSINTVLSYIPKLQFVEIPAVDPDVYACIDEELNQEFVYSLPKQMKAISIYYGYYNETINMPNNIKSLHLSWKYNYANPNCKFNDLEEICLFEPSEEQFSFFANQNLQKLRRIHICDDPNYSYIIDNRQKIQESMRIIFSAPNIEYISLKMDLETYNIFNMIQNIFSQNRKKKSIKIRLEITKQTKFIGITKQTK
eukprot:286006_1